MKVGLYNRWLKTLGGGEKHSLAIAEFLSQDHSVQVITHTPVSKELAAERLNLDLSRVEFKTIPECSKSELANMSYEFDFFINASYMDFFSVCSKYSATLIYFPIPLGSPIIRMRQRLKHMLRRWFRVPQFTNGIYNLETGHPALTWLVDTPLIIRLPSLPEGYPLRFKVAPYQGAVRNVAVLLNGEIIGRLILPSEQKFVEFQTNIPPARQNQVNELVIQENPDGHAGLSNKPFGLFLTDFIIDTLRYRIFYRLFERWFQNIGVRIHQLSPALFLIVDSIDTYDAIWANSEYTRSWIKRYWNRPSDVLYPLIDVDQFQPDKKENKILSVGRFFSGSHNKKHLVMIDAFKEMVDQGLRNWEFHLAGGTTPGADHETYFQKICASVENYPIFIHPDIPFAELVELYGKSSIYWHASGYGEDENEDPGKFEHFGITTVEAMASGCVPVVIGKGGQKEIVRHGRNGYLWDTPEALQLDTWTLIRDPERMKTLSKQALQDSRVYDNEHFQARVRRLLKQIGVSVNSEQ